MSDLDGSSPTSTTIRIFTHLHCSNSYSPNSEVLSMNLMIQSILREWPCLVENLRGLNKTNSQLVKHSSIKLCSVILALCLFSNLANITDHCHSSIRFPTDSLLRKKKNNLIERSFRPFSYEYWNEKREISIIKMTKSATKWRNLSRLSNFNQKFMNISPKTTRISLLLLWVRKTRLYSNT